MNVEEQIEAYLASKAEPKRSDMRTLHRRIGALSPGCRLWFLDGRNGEGRTISNPNIGYGTQTMKQAGGKTREFYRIGLSANTSGISVYIMGLEDRKHLVSHYGARLGKADVTGYCIRFRKLDDIDLAVLEEAIRFGFEAGAR